MHRARESRKLSSQLQAARKFAKCSAKKIRQKIEALLLSKSKAKSFSLSGSFQFWTRTIIQVSAPLSSSVVWIV